MTGIDVLKTNAAGRSKSLLPPLRIRITTTSGAMVEAPAGLMIQTRRGDLIFGQLVVGDELLLEAEGETIWESIVSAVAF